MAVTTLNELPRDMRMMYNKGFEAYQRENFDYAIELFMQVLAREPAVFEIRKTLRDAQAAKSGKGKGFFGRLTSGAASSPLVAKGQMALRKNPLEAMAIAEQILNSDGNSSSGHKLLAEAALAAQLPREAVMSLEILVANAPKDKELNFQLADALADSGRKTEGEDALVALQKYYPGDAEINGKLKDMSARKTLSDGGYDALASGKGSYRDVLRNKEEAVALEQANRQVKAEDANQSLMKDWEERLRAEPNNLRMLRNMAETYAQQKNFDKSLSYYERMSAIDGGNDSALVKTIADVKVRRYEHQISQMDTTQPDYNEKADALKNEKQNFQMDEAKKLADRYPTDLLIRFDLAKLYFEAGKIAEAQQEFQKAQSNPNKRIQSITFLAKCYEKRNMFDLAARRLQEALKEKLTFDEEKKDLVYTLGCVLEKMGKKEESIEQFKQIYELDMSYRDVQKRVEDHYSGGGT